MRRVPVGLPKPGRNDPCPCGSGLKYKKCYLQGRCESSVPLGLEAQLGARLAADQRRKEQFGEVRPIINADHQGRKLVAVGTKVFFDQPDKKWNTFTDFLLNYVRQPLGSGWGQSELKRPLAVHDLSFDVRPGEVLGLLGPNGSGKSTTVKIITGLFKPTSGVVRLNGVDVLADSLTYRASLGYVPEEPHLYSYLTGPEYLQLIGRLRAVPEAVLDDTIDRFLQLLGIYDERYQMLSSYSKGMRQKVLIAAAVLHNPRVVVLDEPLSGLDVDAIRVLKGFVRALSEEGKIVVFSSHVLEVVEQVCSRVLILKDGRAVGHDSVVNLRETLKLPSLDAVFASLVAEENVEDRTRGFVAVMKA